MNEVASTGHKESQAIDGEFVKVETIVHLCHKEKFFSSQF
jgi:hypothetical protein